MLFADGPTACPFVALESDRDRRADEPDPRHRCYAEPTPAPRALAHQREFCLSPQFNRCPIFQDWAIRAAARPVPLRPPGPTADAPAAAAADQPRGPEQLSAFGAPSVAEPPAPPAEPGAVERIPSLPAEEPGAVGEPADAPPAPPAGERARARPRWTDDWPPSAAPAAGGGAGGAWLTPPGSSAADAGQPPAEAGSSAAPAAPPVDREPGRYIPPPAAPLGAPPAASSTATPAEAPMPPFLAGRAAQHEGERPPSRRWQQARPSKRDEWSAQRADLIPAWERERYAAYPTIRTRLGMGDGEALLARLTRILGIIGLVTVAIALLILAPGFFAGAPAASPTPTATASPSGPTPSPTPRPSPSISFGSYTVRAGDSLSGIGVRFGLLPCQIQAANPEITDPNQIFIGQLILIPPDDFALDCANPPTPTTSP